MKEANGFAKEVIKQTNVTVANNTLEIRLYWAGKGTTCIPKRGRYGPLISAISVCPSKSLCAYPFKLASLLQLIISLEFVLGIWSIAGFSFSKSAKNANVRYGKGTIGLSIKVKTLRTYQNNTYE